MPEPTCLQGSLRERSDPLIKTEDRKQEASSRPLRKRKFLSRTFYEPERALKGQNELIHLPPLKESFHSLPGNFAPGEA